MNRATWGLPTASQRGGAESEVAHKQVGYITGAA